MAREGFPRNRRDGPALTGVWNAGCSRNDKPDSLSGCFRSLLSLQSIGEVCGHQQEVLVHLTTPLEIPPLAPNAKSRLCPPGPPPHQTPHPPTYNIQSP